MDEKYYGGFNTWGIAIFLIILFAAFLGNRGGWNNNSAAPAYGCNAVSNCQVEKQGIIDSARTQYLIENTARQTQEQTMAGFSALGTKIDFYEYQNLRDQLASISCRMLPKPEVTGIGAVCPNAGIINGLGINSLNGGCNMV